MLVFGVISPHPPIIIPSIGGRETRKATNTISALNTAARQMADARPERVIIISPHPQHGYEVPLFYLGQHLDPDIKREEILVTNPSYEYYYVLGKQYGAAIAQNMQRTAIIASADLSHVLKDDGPYGYDPAGPQLDEIIIEAVKEKDVSRLLQIDSRLLRHGAECGLRSILFLFGVFSGQEYSTEVLSYEGPFGVGYMVATLG